jgi:hypothetical protein
VHEVIRESLLPHRLRGIAYEGSQGWIDGNKA